MEKDPPKAERYRKCLKSWDFRNREAEPGGDAMKASTSLSRSGHKSKQVSGGGEGGYRPTADGTALCACWPGIAEVWQTLSHAFAVTERGQS